MTVKPICHEPVVPRHVRIDSCSVGNAGQTRTRIDADHVIRAESLVVARRGRGKRDLPRQQLARGNRVLIEVRRVAVVRTDGERRTEGGVDVRITHPEIERAGRAGEAELDALPARALPMVSK